jgi:micrococcal nuclease
MLGTWGIRLKVKGWKVERSKQFSNLQLANLQPLASTNLQSFPTPRFKVFALIERLCIFCGCLLLLVGCTPTPSANGITVQVQRVVSGQTLEILNPTQQSVQQSALIERVRLIGIEAPDLKQQPWGEAAKNRLEQMITKAEGQQIVLDGVFLEPDVQEKDNSGRWLAYVWHDGILLNEQLVKEGYVLAAPRTPNQKYDSRLARAQEYARLMGYGIWNPDEPMRLTPAEFRRQNF